MLPHECFSPRLPPDPVKGYQWLKERVNSEEGRRQLAKIKELHLLADRLGCTAAQLAIGTTRANDKITL